MFPRGPVDRWRQRPNAAGAELFRAIASIIAIDRIYGGNRGDLKLKGLRFQVALAETRRFGPAAAACFVSQPMNLVKPTPTRHISARAPAIATYRERLIRPNGTGRAA